MTSRWRCWGCSKALAGDVRRFCCVLPFVTGAFGCLLLRLAGVVKATCLGGFQSSAARAWGAWLVACGFGGLRRRTGEAESGSEVSGAGPRPMWFYDDDGPDACVGRVLRLFEKQRSCESALPRSLVGWSPVFLPSGVGFVDGGRRIRQAMVCWCLRPSRGVSVIFSFLGSFLHMCLDSCGSGFFQRGYVWCFVVRFGL